MDTKLKNNDTQIKEPNLTGAPDKSAGGRVIGVVLSIALALALSVLVLLFSVLAYSSKSRDYAKVFDDAGFPSALYNYSYSMYFNLVQKQQNNFDLLPQDVFLKDAHGSVTSGSQGDEYYAESFGLDRLAMFDNAMHSMMESWSGESQYNLAHFTTVVDLETGASMGVLNSDLIALAKDTAGADAIQNLQSAYSYYAVLRFNENGQLALPTVYGGNSYNFNALQNSRSALLDEIFSYSYFDMDESLNQELRDNFIGPRNMALVFAVPVGASEQSFLSDDIHYENLRFLRENGMNGVYHLALLLAFCCGLLLVILPKFRLSSLWIAKLPPEAALFSFILLSSSYYGRVESNIMSFLEMLFPNQSLASTTSQQLLAVIWGMLALLSVAFYMYLSQVTAMSLWQVKTLGFRGYFIKKSIGLLLFTRFRTQIMAMYHWVVQIDLTEKSNKSILKILVVNFAILAVLCSIWFFGIFGLVVYTVILFFILQKYTKRLKAQYAALLSATRQMAQGQLHVSIPADLGVFDPLKNELLQVQHGFQQAVEAETKSQNMKTELITNVSHDLKTPLTAIITYVDLLKKEGLTDEERQSYIRTLDLKSQRLKRLIEDLFEMSKASSRDISLNLSSVDLPALIRQVELEACDELRAADIDFRYNFPQEKVILQLDGDKTSRIFENLILNVAKYSLPGTRAYVTVVAGEKLVTIEMKNISRAELNFDNEGITERFVRGDLSRSTEGSGLGLAIAKSFVEAQGGLFKITTDGDLFKAYITFHRSVQAEPILEMEPPSYDNPPISV